MNYDDFSRAIEQERNDIKTINKLAVKHADVFKRLWHLGDGDGGSILDMVRRSAGIEILPVTDRQIYRKKKISHSLSKKVFERDAYRCRHCGSHVDLTVDHIIPESKGGTLDMDNLQTLCRPCNTKKGNR